MSYAFSRLTVDLGAVAANYKLFQSRVGAECQVAGVVKANAYGLGVEAIVPLLDKLGCPFFFVATLEEALKVRTLTSKPVAVLGGLATGAEDVYVAHKLTPVINSPEEILRRTYDGPSIWHIDTGMNRLGIRIDELPQLAEENQPLYVMSHFACADDLDHPLTLQQGKIFAHIAQAFPDSKKSLCNSSGLFRHSEWHYDMVRPGMALYGLNPTPEKPNPMRQTVKLETRILQIHEAAAGESVGYSATHILRRDTRIGIVGLGYADGFLRSGSDKVVLYAGGRPCPVLGRISMDLTAIDLDHCPDLKVGDWVEVLGPQQSPDQLAAVAGTIGYEILTDLGARHERIYLNPSESPLPSP
jgi:alanine racemase